MTFERIKERIQKLESVSDQATAFSIETESAREFIEQVASLESLHSISSKAKLLLTMRDINRRRWGGEGSAIP